MAGTITEIANFFNYSPNRQRCLETVIGCNQPDSRWSKIRDLCRTRWVERHKAYETFALLLPSMVKTFEVILDEQQHQQYSLEMPWNWERETVQKASGRYHTCCSFQFLISLIIGMKTLTVIKPVSIKLQKKSNDILSYWALLLTSSIVLFLLAHFLTTGKRLRWFRFLKTVTMKKLPTTDRYLC